jgi:hypothetical protein
LRYAASRVWSGNAENILSVPKSTDVIRSFDEKYGITPPIQNPPFPKFDWANLPSGTSDRFKDKIKLTSDSRNFPPSNSSRARDFERLEGIPTSDLKLTYHELKRKLRSVHNYAKSTVMYYKYLIKVAVWEINRR